MSDPTRPCPYHCEVKEMERVCPLHGPIKSYNQAEVNELVANAYERCALEGDGYVARGLIQTFIQWAADAREGRL